MHKSLTETLHLRVTAVAVRHQREVGIHTGIPATITKNAFARLEITNVEALTSRANERTRTATKTSFGKLRPSYVTEQFVQVFGLKSRKVECRIGQHLQDFFRCRLLCRYRFFAALGKESRNGRRKSFALFRVRLPVQKFAVKPSGNVALRSGCINAEYAAEAAFFGLRLRVSRSRFLRQALPRNLPHRVPYG